MIEQSKLVDLIDPESPAKIKKNYHLLFDHDILYTCTLNQTDLIQNSNKFHVMQLLKHNKLNTYCLFSRGGRVGYTGQWNCELYTKLETALADWESKFYEKTGASWANRDSIIPQQGKYDYIAMKFIDDALAKESDSVKEPVVRKTIMDADTETLMKLIWDPEVFKNAMDEVRIDSKRMPLGKISKKQIDKAHEILNKIQAYLDSITPNTNDPGDPTNSVDPADPDTLKKHEREIKRLSSQFYTIIPYACGMLVPPAIKDDDALKEKVEQLKLLEELLVVQEKMGPTGNLDLEQKYLALNCNIKPVMDTSVIDLIKHYVQSTSGSTHHFKIKINKIYEIARHGEAERFKTMDNRQLLFHGSRLANFVSILSNGLRINPAPTVVRTGAMFGSAAVYFANASTKSAGYTGARKNCLMLLAEVSLGNTYNLTQAQFISKLPTGLNSTWGQGVNTPDVTQKRMLGDLHVPCGPLVNSNIPNAYLNYDEFIVYNEEQIKLRYLLWVDLA